MINGAMIALAVGIVLATPYVLLQRIAEKARSRRIADRPQKTQGRQSRGATMTRLAIARALDVPCGKIMDEDIFASDYRLGWRGLFVDDYLETVIYEINHQLASQDIPPWRPQGIEIGSVAQLIEALEFHLDSVDGAGGTDL